MKKVFLGGTCANSKWRDKLIPNLKIRYYNPVVKNWTPECQVEEIKQRETCDFVLYTLTRVYSTYSIAEVVDDSHKRPEKTIVCIINEELPNGKLAMTKQDLKHLDAVGRLVERNGAKYFKSLYDVAEYLNKNK
jgi:Nucleoside 2-deoxyribosyltransferase like